ncbi:MAG: clostripain-related cysteine peptidase [Peptococcales bacterium]|jgi:hypothetical protein
MLKDWTILIYANGNNEFEPEMYRLFLDSQKIKPNNNINVVIQIGREKRELVNILRPEDTLIETNDNWTGVRRFCLELNGIDKYFKATLIKDLGNVNMADPKNLYEFVRWGLLNYPSKKTLLMLGGHSFQYLGIMTDYSQDLPYIMGIPEMARALNLLKKNSGRNIDILVLDTCYMNMVEILYELAKEKKHCVKNILTYIEYGPIGGLPIDQLINIIIENINQEDEKLLLAKIIDELDFDLVAFNLSHKKLERIKRLTNDLAKLLANGQNKEMSLADILETDVTKDNPLFSEITNLQKYFKELLIYAKRVSNQKSWLLDIAHKSTSNKLAAYYTRLCFTKNNYWTKILGVESLKEGLNFEESVQLKPLVLPLQALTSLIGVMNHTANDEELQIILYNLLEYKKWHRFSNVLLK